MLSATNETSSDSDTSTEFPTKFYTSSKPFSEDLSEDESETLSESKSETDDEQITNDHAFMADPSSSTQYPPGEAQPPDEDLYHDSDFDNKQFTRRPPPTGRPTYQHPDHGSTKPTTGPWFSFDDIHVTKRRERLQSFAVWIDLQLTKEPELKNVLRKFSSRFTGTLREWFQSLGEYRQQMTFNWTVDQFLNTLHQEFIRDIALYNKLAQQKYFAMKCCSLKKKDLDFHFKRMEELYYALNDYNDPNLKHVFIASLPDDIQPSKPHKGISTLLLWEKSIK